MRLQPRIGDWGGAKMLSHFLCIPRGGGISDFASRAAKMTWPPPMKHLHTNTSHSIFSKLNHQWFRSLREIMKQPFVQQKKHKTDLLYSKILQMSGIPTRDQTLKLQLLFTAKTAFHLNFVNWIRAKIKQNSVWNCFRSGILAQIYQGQFEIPGKSR